MFRKPSRALGFLQVYHITGGHACFPKKADMNLGSATIKNSMLRGESLASYYIHWRPCCTYRHLVGGPVDTMTVPRSRAAWATSSQISRPRDNFITFKHLSVVHCVVFVQFSQSYLLHLISWDWPRPEVENNSSFTFSADAKRADGSSYCARLELPLRRDVFAERPLGRRPGQCFTS